jgi:hypothetical protein
MAKTTRKATTKPRNRAAQDATLINIRTLKQRVSLHDTRLTIQHQTMQGLLRRIVALEAK